VVSPIQTDQAYQEAEGEWWSRSSADIEYRHITSEDLLRQSSFKGMKR